MFTYYMKRPSIKRAEDHIKDFVEKVKKFESNLANTPSFKPQEEIASLNKMIKSKSTDLKNIVNTGYKAKEARTKQLRKPAFEDFKVDFK